MIIYGVNYSNPDSVSDIHDRIRLRVEQGELFLITDRVPLGIYDSRRIRLELQESSEGNACDPAVNEDLFKLIDSYFGVTLIGLGHSAPEPNPLAKQELNMAKVLRGLSHDIKRKAMVLVNDVHLRCTTTKELGGPSKIHLAVLRGTLDAQVVRADKAHREVE